MSVRSIQPLVANHRPPPPQHDETTDTELEIDEEANLTQSNSRQTKSTGGLTCLASWRSTFSSIGGVGWLSYAFQSIIAILLVIILFKLVIDVEEIKNHAIFNPPTISSNNEATTSNYGNQESSANIDLIVNPPFHPKQVINTQFPTKTPALPTLPASGADAFLDTTAIETCSCTKVKSELSSLITTLRQLAPHDRPEEGVDELDELLRPIERGGSSRREYAEGRAKGIPFSYSQFGQDTKLVNTYPHTFQKRSGTYLEIGGRNGYYLSNTYMYERFLDWTGMIVEMNPHWKDLVELSRPGSIWINGAISVENGTVEVGYMDGYSAGLAGLTSVVDKARIQREVAERPQNRITARVPTYRLGHLLPKYGLNRIDFFSLGVEGAEYTVLETIDWSVTQFKFILIEINPRIDECAKLLQSHSYQLIDTWEQDQLWTLPEEVWLPQTCTVDQCHGLQRRLKYFKEKHHKYLSGTMKYLPPHLTGSN